MERRDAVRLAGLVFGGTALASPALAARALAEKAKAPAGAASPERTGVAGSEALAEVAGECARACEVCIMHCQSLLAQGNTMLGDCLKRCLELVPLCEATGTLSNYGSTLLPKIAAVCLEACEACAASCKPHVAHHAQCKTCYEACLKCIVACKAA